MFYAYKGIKPVVHESAFVHPQAIVTGDVEIGKQVYIGPGAAIRGDFGKIIIEDGCNVQENCTIHMFPGVTVRLKENAHIGHGAIIHGAEIGRNCLVGMNAVIMDNVVLGDECIVGALTFIKAGETYPARSLIVGNPARVIKDVSDEMIQWKTEGTQIYQQLASDAHAELVPCEPLREVPASPANTHQLYKTWDKTKNIMTDKLSFLKNDFVTTIRTINPDTKPLFGKMNVHQMIEHMSDAVRQASGFIRQEATGDAETTEKMYRFMMSDKPFRDNTPNPFLPDEPNTPRHGSVDDSLNQLQIDIETFINIFKSNPEKRILNPFFGNLNFDEWVHLLHKHALHHLRQFGVQVSERNNP